MKRKKSAGGKGTTDPANRMKLKYENVIFDFDGTLSDTYPCFTNALLDLLKYYGINDTYENAYALLKVSVGHALKHYDLPEDLTAAGKRFHYFHELRAPSEQKPYPDAGEILRFIRVNGGRNYVYTHSGLIVTKLLGIWGLDGYIDGMLDSTVTLPRKPAPDGLNWLCGKYGLDKSVSIMVGDRDIDTDCARNAGIAGCLYDPEGYYTDTVSDYSITKLTDLEKIITI